MHSYTPCIHTVGTFCRPLHPLPQINVCDSGGRSALTLAAASAQAPGSSAAMLQAVLAAGPELGAQQGLQLLKAALAAKWDAVAAQVGVGLP